MAIVTWDDIVNQAYVDANVIQPGEVLTQTLLTDGENRLNELISSLSAEGLTAFQQVMQVFQLSAGVTGYTLGVGGTWGTALRAQKATSWQAASGDMREGGPVLSMEQLGVAASAYQKDLAQLAAQAALAGLTNGVPSPLTTPIPKFVAADTAFPLISVRVWPPPSNTPGLVELAYFTPIAQITNFAAPFSLPEGWPDMLHFNLGVRIYHIYPRAGGMPATLAANAQNTKAALVAQNVPEQPTAQQQQ